MRTASDMSAGTIIAGRFDTFEQAEAARSRLEARGFPHASTSVFFNNPPGRHDQTEIGGDEHADPQARDAAAGAVTGAAAGATIALAAAAGPLGVALAGVGAYVGSLAGAISSTDQASVNRPLRRASGVMVAVNIGSSGREVDAISALKSTGADSIERAEGNWRDGDWADFDPVATPRFVEAIPGGPVEPAAARS